jgi:hypothetical protein
VAKKNCNLHVTSARDRAAARCPGDTVSSESHRAVRRGRHRFR